MVSSKALPGAVVSWIDGEATVGDGEATASDGADDMLCVVRRMRSPTSSCRRRICAGNIMSKEIGWLCVCVCVVALCMRV